ncbi:cytochrome-c peroxidase [Taibaiella koreensis]|uniref:cytochrome-c peroxidase n=1 Tax=Taibaiella koreensis TaxID=1268548 RepID=UPI000E59ED45|nr:cytochrome c peroxidase [Taibaiella koreensis]
MNKVIITLLVCSCLLLLAGRKDAPEAYRFRSFPFFPAMPVDSTNKVTDAGARLGRYLFYDTILSARKNMSCASCHKQAVAFSDASLRFSKGSEGVLMIRNTPPLFNLAWYPALFWDGRAASIEAQVSHPLTATDEMNLQWPLITDRINSSAFYRTQFKTVFGTERADSSVIVKAIGQFLRTIISDRSRYDSVLKGKRHLTLDETDGLVLMNDQTKGACLHCHTTDADALGTTGQFSNIGLEPLAEAGYNDKGRGGITGRPADKGSFKIPSLRNIALTGPYMHDGRFATLEAVLDYYSDSLQWRPGVDPRLRPIHTGPRLSPEEKKKIIAFLHTLTDSALISDREYGDPFKQ